jgi:hypothetical protein
MTVGGLLIGWSLLSTLALPLLAPLVPLAVLQALVPFPVKIQARILAPIVPAEGESDAEVAGRVRRALQDAVGDGSPG